jgi:hypothetical protein
MIRVIIQSAIDLQLCSGSVKLLLTRLQWLLWPKKFFLQIYTLHPINANIILMN